MINGNHLEKTLWAAVIFLAVISSASAIRRAVVVATRSVDRTMPGIADRVDIRYNESPFLTYFHVTSGLAFMILGPLQFSRRLRARHLNVHRWVGRIFLIVGTVAAIVALIMAAQPSTYIGLNAIAATYFFGLAFIFCAAKAYYHIRRKEIILHREWMIRAFAIGLGVSTVRVVAVPLFLLLQPRLQEIMGTSFWIGWSINMIAAEVWINVTRAQMHARA